MMITLNDQTTIELQELLYTDLVANGSLDLRAGAYVLDSLERHISHTERSAGADVQRRGPLGRGLGLVADTLLRSWDQFSNTLLADRLNVLAEIQTLAQIARVRLGDLPDSVVGRDSQARDRILEKVGTILDKAAAQRDEKISHRELARQIAKAAGMTTADRRALIVPWLATIYSNAVRIGIEQICAALIGQNYSHALEQPTLLYEPTYALLRTLALADEAAQEQSAPWTPFQHQIWSQIANEAGARVWVEITILAAACATPIPLRKRADAFNHLLAHWTEIIPSHHPNPAETDWGRWPSASGTEKKIRTDAWDAIAARLGSPDWTTDIALLLYGRLSTFQKSRPRKRKRNKAAAPRPTSDKTPRSNLDFGLLGSWREVVG